ncbi:MAG: glycosyltransferase family 2 protein [Romboutsia timonensis]|jgi:glycosyltransferase related enzyme|uniref:glycosyltransferase family 2 protein n=1 Tax=Romboutsia timonensis TaxID=1776391 RepID=UPI00399257C9
MDEKLVSIIIPIYNSEKYLKKCIDSILEQKYNNLEIILINDGSTDNSGKICDRLAIEDKRIKVIHKLNEGVSIARNKGLEMAKGEYIFFIDSDDYIDENIIKDMISYSRDYDIVKVSYKFIENGKITKVVSNNLSYKKDEYIKAIISSNIGGHSWGYLLKRSTLEGIYFDKNTSCMEDTVFIISCILKSKSIKCINSSYYNYRINENGITCSSDRIFKNINDYMYSVDKIKEIIDNSDIKYNCNYDILRKKVILIEAEVSKIKKKEEIKILFKNKMIKDELNNIFNSTKINLAYRIFIYIVVNEKYNLTMLYIKIRRLMKNIKSLIY